MVLTRDDQIDDFIHETKYKAIIDVLIDNIPNIIYTPPNTITIKKNDLIFSIGPKETPIFMKYLFQINNFICNEYRKRIRILNSTKRV